MLTAKKIRSLIVYDPETGIIRNRIDRRQSKAGKIIGTVNVPGYVVVRIDKKLYLAHRVAWKYMTGRWPSKRIDHRDRDKTNNAWINLRQVTQSQNVMNAVSWKRSTPGRRGTWFDKSIAKWWAYINVGQMRHNLGYFESYEQAVVAREKAEIGLFGEYRAIQ